MFFRTEHVLVWTRRFFPALAVAALALGCGTNGDQLLGTIQPETTLFPPDASTSVDDGGGACLLTQYAAQPVGQELSISLLIDRSASPLDPHNDRWDALFAGLTRFFHSNDADGVNLGAVYYPATGTQDPCSRCGRDCMCLAGCGCPCDQHGDPRMCSPRTMCDSSDYTRPDVEMAPMPQNAGNLAVSLAPLPSGPATLRPALQGALDHANWYQTQPPNQNQRAVVVLVASWGPSTECPPDAVDDAANVAASSNEKTYVVEFNYDGPDLGPIAMKGGGGRGVYQFDSRHDDVAMRFGALVQDLERDQQTFSCQYALPTAITDPNALTSIQVQMVDDAGASSTLEIPRVKSRFACDNQLSWYYDQSDHPTRIVICDQLCKTIHSTAAKVMIPRCVPVPPPP